MKLPNVFKSWPSNTVATSRWLGGSELSRQLIHKYCESGWIEKIEHGVFKKAGENIDWTGAVYAVQSQLNLDIFPGGYTALDMHGYRHHVAVQSRRTVSLYGPPRTPLPRWLIKTDFGATLNYQTSSLFPQAKYVVEKEIRGNYVLKISVPERAIFEILNDINDQASFEDAANIVSVAINLRAELITEMLLEMKSFRVKRLFFYLAKYNELPIMSSLERENVDFGRGVIQVVKDGQFDSEFQIMIPQQFKKVRGNPF